MARSLMGAVRQGGGIGLYVLPSAVIALTPALVLVYLGIRIMRAERLAVYALVAVMVLIGGVIVALDTRRGGYVLGAAVVGLAPLVRVATRESGGFQ